MKKSSNGINGWTTLPFGPLTELGLGGGEDWTPGEGVGAVATIR